MSLLMNLVESCSLYFLSHICPFSDLRLRAKSIYVRLQLIDICRTLQLTEYLLCHETNRQTWLCLFRFRDYIPYLFV